MDNHQLQLNNNNNNNNGDRMSMELDTTSHSSSATSTLTMNSHNGHHQPNVQSSSSDANCNKPKRPCQLPLQMSVDLASQPQPPPPPSTSSTNSTIDDDVVVVVRLTSHPRIENNRLMCLKIPYDTASKDSDSLINDSYYYETEKFDSRSCWWSHPKVRQNWRIVVSAFVLLIIGIGLVATGFLVEIMPIAGFKGVVFFVAGAICFIPGAYHVVYVYFAVRGRRGFDFTNLPLFT